MENANSNFMGSNLITNTKARNYIQTLFNKKIKSTLMLYVDKEEDISDPGFYQSCVDNGNLFFITKSSSDKIFGGLLPNGLKSSKVHKNYYKKKKVFYFL